MFLLAGVWHWAPWRAGRGAWWQAPQGLVYHAEDWGLTQQQALGGGMETHNRRSCFVENGCEDGERDSGRNQEAKLLDVVQVRVDTGLD